MSSEIVKYGNQLNTVPFRNFNRKDLNIFFAIVSRLRNKGSRKVTLSFTKIVSLSNLHYHHHPAWFIRDLSRAYTKLIHITYFQNTPTYFKKGVLFDTFYIDKKHRTCTVRVNPEFTGVLNHLANWTRFSLEQFTNLRSSYSKNCFRLLKQWRTQGEIYLPMKRFRLLLSIPKSYSNTQISQRVIEPIEVELTPLVRGLHVIKVKHGRGGRIIGFKFTFTPERNNADDFSKGKYEDRQIMLKNIRFNSFLPDKLKHKAYRRIYRTKEPIPARKMTPIKAFNRMIKGADLDQLRYFLSLHYTHSKAVNFSEYQVRKLKKAIFQKVAKEGNYKA